MKNILVYYLAILIPFGTIVFLELTKKIDGAESAYILLFYFFIYRTITDYSRLLSKNIISKKDLWIMAIPGSRIKYFKELYLS